MATTKKQPVKKSPAKKAVVKKNPINKTLAKKGYMQVPVGLGKTATVKKAAAKKVSGPTKAVDSVTTIEHQLKSKTQDFACLAKQYSALFQEHVGLKKSFAMLKDNYEREKNRLDKVIDASLNNSKALEAITNTDLDLSDDKELFKTEM
jgi:hypothetical protein